jgi:hypothetical protein
MGGREINLDGGEIAVLKAIGTSGSQVFGKMLVDRLGDLAEAELIETLCGLISQGYVVSNRVNIRLMADVQSAFFRVNPAMAKELRGAMNPARRRNEQRARRDRRG